MSMRARQALHLAALLMCPWSSSLLWLAAVGAMPPAPSAGICQAFPPCSICINSLTSLLSQLFTSLTGLLGPKTDSKVNE